MTEPEIAILQKYKILNPDGSTRMVDLKRPIQSGGRPPGPGPLISQDAVNKLLAADTTPDQHWLDWIFYQAAGGEKAKEATADALKQIYERFIDERVNGYTHQKSGKYYGPIPREDAEARWKAAEPEFQRVMAVSDQDTRKRLRIFGYFRDWPGDGGIYSQVVEAMNAYLKMYPKLQEMNAEVAREGGTKLPETPELIKTPDEMKAIASKVERYFASKAARTDIRIADDKPVYDDDNITAVVPLTYAASVKYGYEHWPWSNRANFENVLSGEGPDYQRWDDWKGHTGKGNVFIFLHFKSPTPAWVTRKDGEWILRDFTDLALELNKDIAGNDPDTWTVHDQENRQTLTVAQVKERIMAEPTRTNDGDDESPITRGGNVYSTADEATAVVGSLDAAVHAVARWFRKFDHGRIKQDALTLD